MRSGEALAQTAITSLSAGSLSAGLLQINAGTFEQTGGTFTPTAVLINAGSLDISAGAFTANSITNNDTLNVANVTLPDVAGTGSTSIYPGATATAASMTQTSVFVQGTLNLTGASTSTIGFLETLGTIIQSAGTLTASTINNYQGISPSAMTINGVLNSSIVNVGSITVNPGRPSTQTEPNPSA